MASFTRQVEDLRKVGPILELTVGPTTTLAPEPGARQPSRHRPLPVVAMIDTGASVTVIAPSVVRALGLRSMGAVLIHTPAATRPIAMRQFPVSISFPSGVRLSPLRAVEAPLGDSQLGCLIGRDVLAAAVLVYDGRAGEFSLTF